MQGDAQAACQQGGRDDPGLASPNPQAELLQRPLRLGPDGPARLCRPSDTHADHVAVHPIHEGKRVAQPDGRCEMGPRVAIAPETAHSGDEHQVETTGIVRLGQQLLHGVNGFVQLAEAKGDVGLEEPGVPKAGVRLDDLRQPLIGSLVAGSVL